MIAYLRSSVINPHHIQYYTAARLIGITQLTIIPIMFRKLVAGPKVRTVENGFDLDLSFITTRVIAMAFPAQGFEKIYRNSIDDVSEYLKDKYGSNYMLYNLSGRKYDYKKFQGNVRQFQWEDHQAPTLYTLFQICQEMMLFLKENEENVVVIHCNHGKGRTGTVIVSFLLFCNFLDTPEYALKFYAKQRFEEEGYGVTQPCQIRYVHYLHSLLLTRNVRMKPYSLKRIRLRGKNSIDSCYCIVSQVRTRKVLVVSNPLNNGVMEVEQKSLLLGDLFLEFKIPGLFGIGQKQLARLNINTIFLPENKILTLSAKQISPDNLTKKFKGVIGKDFAIEMVFQDYCQCRDNQTTQANLCFCQRDVKEEMFHWQGMCQILKQHKMPTKDQSVGILFGEMQEEGGRYSTKSDRGF